MNLALRRTVYAPFVLNSLRWGGRYEADLQSGNDGDTVASWTDQSRNSRHLTQATGTAQPTIQRAELNGHDVISFDGTDDRVAVAFPANAQPYLVALVGKLRSLTAGTAFQPMSVTNGVLQVSTANNFTWFAGATLTATAADTNPFVVLVVANGTATSVIVNGTQANGNGGTAATSNIIVGAGGTGSLPTPLDAAFAGVVAPAPSSRMTRRLYRELRCRFGV